MTKYPEGLRLRDRDGLLPAHVASVQGTKAHLEILLQAYPASVAERTEPRAGLGKSDCEHFLVILAHHLLLAQTCNTLPESYINFTRTRGW